VSETDPFAGQWRSIESVLADQQPASTDKRTPEATRLQKIIIGGVAAGSLFIAGIGFTGSYSAVAQLAREQGFGKFSDAFPIGIDAGIGVLLALDLVLTWFRIPFPLLRHFAWLLTVATIAFNAAASWPHALGVSMHAVIPTLFIVIVEAARHAIGRLADITADANYENPPLIRWILSPWPTYRIWRRMRLWNLRSYTLVIALEKQRREYKVRLRVEHGRGWRRTASRRERLAMNLSKFGTSIEDTLAENHAEPVHEPDEPEPSVYREPANQAKPTATEPGTTNQQPLEPAPRANPEPAAPAKEPRPANRKAPREPAEPRTGNQVGDRAAKKTAQIDEVLNLITELGYDAVTLAEVQNRTGMTKTTAYHRLTDARTKWNQENAA
jgi:hypothetical protein